MPSALEAMNCNHAAESSGEGVCGMASVFMTELETANFGTTQLSSPENQTQ
jgi:hypothetical protein